MSSKLSYYEKEKQYMVMNAKVANQIQFGRIQYKIDPM